MLASRMIPMLWVRLVILIGFMVFVAFNSSWIFVAIAGVLVVITGFQLMMAYQSRRDEEARGPSRRI